MSEKVTTSSEKEQITLKERLMNTVSVVYDWLKQNFAVVIAVFVLMLCFGLPDVLMKVLDTTLLYVTNFGRNGWTDFLFAVLTIWACIDGLFIVFCIPSIFWQGQLTPQGMLIYQCKVLV